MVSAAVEYEWSSHRVYLGAQTLSWVTTEFGLSLLGRTIESARKEYAMLIAQSHDSVNEVTDEANTNDRRILGTDRFVASLSPPSFKPRSFMTLEQAAEEVCQRHDISVDQARSEERSTLLTAVRVAIARQAMDGRVASQNQIAKCFNRSASSLSELLKRHP